MREVGIFVMKCHGGGEGVKKWSNLCYVIDEQPLTWYTVGIWIPTIWIPETFEYQTFWSSDFKCFGIQMVGECAISYVLDQPFIHRQSPIFYY